MVGQAVVAIRRQTVDRAGGEILATGLRGRIPSEFSMDNLVLLVSGGYDAGYDAEDRLVSYSRTAGLTQVWNLSMLS